MKKNFLKLTALVLLLVMALTACGAPTETPSTEPDADTTTEAETTNDVYIEREDKKVKNILMIGNSFCYYFTEELYGIAKANGQDLVIANLYKSGCNVEEHWKWLNDNSRSYEFYVTSTKYKGNFKAVNRSATINEALEYAQKELGGDWDVITLQQHFGPDRATNYDLGRELTLPCAKKLFDRIKADHPDATMYWQQTWAYEVGYAVADKYVDPSKAPGGIAIDSVEVQTLSYNNIKKVSQEVAKENGVNLIPSGDAWQIARADARVGDTMCKRLGTNGDLGDYYHDGDVGGGQYLNACVWYEVLTGNSCVGNTWRPTYELSEEKIEALQTAAHEAVAAVYGPGYAK